MQGEIEHRGVVVEDVLCAVPVVHVPVDDQHTLPVRVVLDPARPDRDVVEQAEAHCPGRGGVMTRWPGGHEGVGRGAVGDGFGGGDHGAAAPQRRLPRCWRHHGVRVQRRQALRASQRDGLPHALYVIGRVHPEHLGLGGFACLALLDPVVECQQVPADGGSELPQSALVLGVAPTSVVQGSGGVEVERGGCGHWAAGRSYTVAVTDS